MTGLLDYLFAGSVRGRELAGVVARHVALILVLVKNLWA